MLDEREVADVRQRDAVSPAEQPNRRQSTRAIAWTAIITTLISAPLGAILTHGLARLLDAYNTARASESANVLDYVQPDGLTGDGVVGVVGDQLEVSGKLIQLLPRGRVLYTASRIASAGTGPRINDGPVGYGVLPCDVDEVAMTFACDRRPLGIAEDSGQNFYVWLIMPNASQLREIISRSNAQQETNQLQDPPGPVWVSPTYVILRK